MHLFHYYPSLSLRKQLLINSTEIGNKIKEFTPKNMCNQLTYSLKNKNGLNDTEYKTDFFFIIDDVEKKKIGIIYNLRNLY